MNQATVWSRSKSDVVVQYYRYKTQSVTEAPLRLQPGHTLWFVTHRIHVFTAPQSCKEFKKNKSEAGFYDFVSLI